MKTILTFGFILVGFVIRAQIITTIVGNGTATNTGDGGLATSATINYPVQIIFDKEGNYYFGLGDNGDCIRKVATDGTISKFAGTGVAGFSGDGGLATAAQFDNVQGILFDTSYNMYVVDRWNHRIRRIDAITGIISTYAGKGTSGYSGDGGLAINAELNGPGFICFDKHQNLYISDCTNYRIRRVAPTGIITTIAGNGIAGLGGTGVPATSVAINAAGLLTDSSDNLYFADDHGRVFKISPTGLLSYFIGDGTGFYGGDGGPAYSASLRPMYLIWDKFGNLIISESYMSRIRIVNPSGIIQTLAGSGVEGYGGDGGPATGAMLDFPAGIAVDTCGDLYIPDAHKWRIRKVTFPKCGYLGVEEALQNSREQTSVYPNPAQSEITITATEKIKAVTITNVLGQSVFRQVYNNKEKIELNIAHLSSGMYLVRVNDKWVQRFMKE
jgi:hypothetical protein